MSRSVQGRGLTLRERLLAILAITLVMFLATATGCGTTSAERVATVQQTLDTYETRSADLDQAIAELRGVIDQARAILAVAEGDEAESIVAFIADAEAQLDKLVAQKPTLDTAVATWRAKLTEIQANPNVGWADEMQAAGAGLQASAPLFGPYGWIVSGLGLLIGAVGTAFGVARGKQARPTPA